MLISVRFQVHFENVQRISDTAMLPFSMHYLRSRIMEELDILHLTERLLQGKGEIPACRHRKRSSTTGRGLKFWVWSIPVLYHPVAWLVINKHRAWVAINVINFFMCFFVLSGPTRTMSSMWAMTLLSIYVRVEVTILGRHLYLDFARGTDMAQLQVNLFWSDPS
jgi:peroxin-3